MKTHRLTKAMSLLTALLMLFALCAVPALADGGTAEAKSLTDYHAFAEANGWWGKGNEINSVWIKPQTDYLGTRTDGYYEGWSMRNPITTGTHHPKGVGMHTAQGSTPSITYDIEALKVTSLKTAVFLVQYDRGTSPELLDVDTTTEGTPYGASTVKVYFAVSADNETYTNIKEQDLSGKGNHIDIELTESDLQGAKYLRFGLSNKHANADSDPAASVYFADLTITQSEEVAGAYVPPIPMRPAAAPSQLGAYEAIDLPMISDNNYDGKPYGTWKAGQNTLYYLSDLIPDGIPSMNGNVELPEGSKYLTSSNTTNDTWLDGQPTTKDYPYGASSGTAFTFGAPQFEYTKGIGMHPKNPNAPYKDRTDSWTLFDISEYTKEGSATPANTFYALVGLTASANEWGSLLSCQGLYVYVYGDKVGDGEHFEFLAASGEIISYQLGEFNVDVTGVKTLLIQVILQENATSHGYSAVGFGDACLFMADENAQKPDYSTPTTPENPGSSETPNTPEKPGSDTKPNGKDTTGAPTGESTPTQNHDGKQSDSCASVIGYGEFALLGTVCAGAVCFRKRKKHD